MAQNPLEQNTADWSRSRQSESRVSSVVSLMKDTFYLGPRITRDQPGRNGRHLQIRPSSADIDPEDYNDTDDDFDESNTENVTHTQTEDNNDSNVIQVKHPIRDELIPHFKKVMLWHDPVDSFLYLLMINVLYWSYWFKISRDITVVVFICTHMIQLILRSNQWKEEDLVLLAKIEKFDKIYAFITSDFQNILNVIRDHYPILFAGSMCATMICPVFTVLYLNPFVILFIVLLSFFIVPGFIFWCLKDEPSVTGMDGGYIFDLIPEVTEDNIDILNRASESGDSSTPSNSQTVDVTTEAWTEEELDDVIMPSHDEDESDDDVLNLDPRLVNAESANLNSENVGIVEEVWEDEELEGASMPSHEEDTDDELIDLEIQWDEDSGLGPRSYDYGRLTVREIYGSDESSDETDECDNEEKEDTNIEESETEHQEKEEKLDSDNKHLDVEESDNKHLDVEESGNKHLDVEESDNSSDGDFEIIGEEELKELKIV